jgi:cell division control protein 11
MRRLAPRVNVIPVIGKSDSLTPSELQAFKRRVMEDIEHYNIPVYNFPYDVEEDDDETIQDNSELRVRLFVNLSETPSHVFKILTVGSPIRP